jgi:hypothetical protein
MTTLSRLIVRPLSDAVRFLSFTLHSTEVGRYTACNRCRPLHTYDLKRQTLSRSA